MSVLRLSSGIDHTRQSLIYRGDLLILKNLGALRQLCDGSRQLAASFF